MSANRYHAATPDMLRFRRVTREILALGLASQHCRCGSRHSRGGPPPRVLAHPHELADAVR